MNIETRIKIEWGHANGYLLRGIYAYAWHTAEIVFLIISPFANRKTADIKKWGDLEHIVLVRPEENQAFARDIYYWLAR